MFRIIHQYKPSISENPLIQDFFKAKKKSEVKLPTLQQMETWDINILINYIHQNFKNNNELPLERLQEKTIILLCVATMWRPRSDLGALQLRDIHFSPGGYRTDFTRRHSIYSNIKGITVQVFSPGHFAKYRFLPCPYSAHFHWPSSRPSYFFTG